MIEAPRETKWIAGTNWQTVLLEQKEAQVTESGEMLLRDAKNSTILTIQKETIDRNYIEGAGLSDTMLGVGKAIQSIISLDQRIILSQCKSFDEFINVERRYFSVIDEVIELGKTVSYEMKMRLCILNWLAR
ncbi:MAG: hypothetical protein OI717_00655 (plasmid) [Candidatus Methanoperedens sp.]|nr:MAG: hypothetical protein OI717_00655 [Candidatus Methanoperedens sp.]